MNILDIIIIVIIGLEVITCSYKGFVASIFRLTSFLLAIIITKKYYTLMASILAKNEKIYSAINEFAIDKSQTIMQKMAITSSDNVFETMKLPEQIKDSIVSNSSTIGGSGLVDNSQLALVLTNLVINVLAILVVFILVKIAVTIIFKILESVVQIPGLKQLNHLLGLVLGAVKGVLMISFIFVILSPIIAMSPDGVVAGAMDGSKLADFFYSNNVILYILKDTSIVSSLW